MKKVIILIIILCWTNISLRGAAILCNSEGYCYEVIKVLIDNEWYRACCYNVTIHDDFSCEDDCDLAKLQQRSDLTNTELTPTNAYVLFNQGYRTWVLKDGQPKTPKDLTELPSDFNIETIRSFLPIARTLFQNNHELEGLSLKFSRDIDIVIGRPSEENLKEEITFKDYSAYEQDLKERGVRHLDAMDIHPNPATKNLTISLRNGASINQVEILNASGQLNNLPEAMDAANHHSIDIDLLELKPGVYVIRVYDHQGRLYLKKFLKK